MIKKTNNKSDIKSAAKRPTPRTKRSTTPARVRQSSTPARVTPEVTFALYKPDAERVFLSGPFNGWFMEATPLNRQPNRDWNVTVALPAGRHEYKFVVDGRWMIDPRGSHFVPNDFGSLNSVIEVKA
jgi:1,4-alpha-glucan branching enzyme